jgi:hypothetical protein
VIFSTFKEMKSVEAPVPAQRSLLNPAEELEDECRRPTLEGLRRRKASGLGPAFLFIDRGPGSGKLVPIPEGELLVGRSSACGMRLTTASVSRQHAVVRRDGNRFFLRDSNSHNGTFLNGRRLAAEAEVFGEDEITIGGAVLILRGGKAIRTGRATAVPVYDRASVRLAVFSVAIALGLAIVVGLGASGGSPHPPSGGGGNVSRTGRVSRASDSAGGRPSLSRSSPTTSLSLPLTSAPEASQGAPISASSVFEQTRARPARVVASPPSPRSAAPAAKVVPKRKAAAADASESLAAFEAGRTADALRIARAAGQVGLAKKIAGFQGELDAAKRSAASGDGAAAIRHYQGALDLDKQLSGGWSRNSGAIRLEVSRLYTLAADQARQAGDEARARKLAERALGFDSSNSAAQRLVPSETVRRPVNGPVRSANAADAAFDE